MSVTAVVDFGSSHTVTVVHVPGAAPRVVTVDGEPWLPSAVFLSRDDQLVVGADALRMAAADPARLESSAKTRIAEREVLLDDTVVPVTTIVRAVLARAVRAAAAVAGAPVDHLVLTHPADWSAERLGGLLAAAQGVAPRISTLVEAVGAGVWFATRGAVGVDGADRFPLGAVLGVLDLGGGTVDVAVVRRMADGIVVVGRESIPDLGGGDFDRRVADHLRASVPGLADRLAAAADGNLAGLRELGAFRREVRRAKELLSRHERVDVRLPGGLAPVTLTRADLERVLYRDLDRITAFTLRAVLRSGVEARQLTALQLVGGSARIPLLHRLLAEVFPVPIALDDQPEAVVAVGACTIVAAHVPPAPAPAQPERQRFPVLGVVLVLLLAVAGVAYGLAGPAATVPGAAAVAVERFTLPPAARGPSLVSGGGVADGLVTGQLGVPVRMFDGDTDVDWTVHGISDAIAAPPPPGTRWVLVDAEIRARSRAEAPYYLADTFLVDDRGLLIPPETTTPLPQTCPNERPAVLRAGQNARQCLAFAVARRTPVRAVAISTVSDGGQIGVTVPVRADAAPVAEAESGLLAQGVARPVSDGAVRLAVVDVVTSAGAYADAGVIDRPGSKAVVVRVVAEAERPVAVPDLAARLRLHDDRRQPVAPRLVSDRQGCAAGTASGRFTMCAVFVLPSAVPLASVSWTDRFTWRLT